MLKFLLQNRCSQINDEAVAAAAVVVVGGIIWFLLPQIIDPEVRPAHNNLSDWLGWMWASFCLSSACRLIFSSFFFPDPD